MSLGLIFVRIMDRVSVLGTSWVFTTLPLVLRKLFFPERTYEEELK